MTILRPQFFRGASVKTGDRIQTESRKVAAVLTKLGRAREIPDLDRSEPFNLPDKDAPLVTLNPQQVANIVGLTKELLLASETVPANPAKRAYKKRTYKRRGPAKRK